MRKVIFSILQFEISCSWKIRKFRNSECIRF